MKINPDDIKSNDEHYLELIGDFIKGEIIFDEYLVKRGKHRTEKLSELKLIVNDKPEMFNLYLSKVSVGYRIIAMKMIFSLSNEELARNTGYSKTVITDFVRENNELDKNYKVYKQRNFSFELIHDLSIVLDIPHRYIGDARAEFKMINSFVEYERTIIKQLSMQELIGNTIIEMKKKSRESRNIFGVKIKNEFFNYENIYLNARVDIREKFFTVELYLENDASINYRELFHLENSINMKNEIFIRNAFLRANKKLCISILIDDSFTPSVTYLCERFLWRNMLL